MNFVDVLVLFSGFVFAAILIRLTDLAERPREVVHD